MQNDSNVQMLQTEISNHVYVLTVETHEGEMHKHPLTLDEAKVIGKMALSGTARMDLLKNFFHSIRNQHGEFSHIQKWLENILASTKTKFFTVQMEKIDPPQAKIPDYLQCEPRTYKVNFDQWNDSFELEFTITIKCTDEMLHEHNKFWSNHADRLNDNNGNIVAVLLRLIAVDVFHWCITHNSNSLHEKYGVNSIFHEEGWISSCFKITQLYFENSIRGEDFEFEPVQVEG